MSITAQHVGPGDKTTELLYSLTPEVVATPFPETGPEPVDNVIAHLGYAARVLAAETIAAIDPDKPHSDIAALTATPQDLHYPLPGRIRHDVTVNSIAEPIFSAVEEKATVEQLEFLRDAAGLANIAAIIAMFAAKHELGEAPGAALPGVLSVAGAVPPLALRHTHQEDAKLVSGVTLVLRHGQTEAGTVSDVRIEALSADPQRPSEELAITLITDDQAKSTIRLGHNRTWLSDGKFTALSLAYNRSIINAFGGVLYLTAQPSTPGV